MELWKRFLFARRISIKYNKPIESLLNMLDKDRKNELITRKTLEIKEQNVECDILPNNLYHMNKVLSLYDKWKECNVILTELGSRRLNIPEGISEKIFCFHTGCIIIKKAYNIKSSSSFDCYNPHTKKTVQLKASSVLNDCTSFGPSSEWEELYFMHIDSLNNKYTIWEIDSQILYNCKVNNTTTFRQQQDAGKRPRLSIRKNFIEKYNLTPTWQGVLL